MRFSQKGLRDNRKRLVRSIYLKYILDDKEYFFKEKTYLTHHDGWIETETIKKRTYINATKRGNECIEIKIEEDIKAASLNCLGIIYNEEYEIGEADSRGLILKTRKVIENIKRDSDMSAKAEYKMFRKIMDKHIKQIKEEEQ